LLYLEIIAAGIAISFLFSNALEFSENKIASPVIPKSTLEIRAFRPTDLGQIVVKH
jgi:hypothetical protein